VPKKAMVEAVLNYSSVAPAISPIPPEDRRCPRAAGFPTVALSTLAPQQRTEGAGLFSLARNIGSSVGISAVNALLTRNTQVNHADIVQHVTAVNRVFADPTIAQFWNPLTAAGRAALDAMITRQAQIIAYIDDYKLLMIATLVVIPLLIVFRRAPASGGQDHALVLE
jgi:MFS transporter, DHA2 family, multidrug resistance protein